MQWPESLAVTTQYLLCFAVSNCYVPYVSMGLILSHSLHGLHHLRHRTISGVASECTGGKKRFKKSGQKSLYHIHSL